MRWPLSCGSADVILAIGSESIEEAVGRSEETLGDPEKLPNDREYLGHFAILGLLYEFF